MVVKPTLLNNMNVKLDHETLRIGVKIKMFETKKPSEFYMDVSENNGTPKSSMD